MVDCRTTDHERAGPDLSQRVQAYYQEHFEREKTEPFLATATGDSHRLKAFG